MKKFLLSILLIGSFLLGKAQVVFNEFYPNPGSGKDEYLELYNTSGDIINLDCWSIFAWNNTTNSGYLYQLPNMTIAPYSWLVFTGSTANPLTILYSQPAKTYSGSNIYSWNGTDATDSYLKLYSKSGSTLEPGGNLTNVTDFLLDPSGGSGISLFLFNGGTLVNAFIGSGSPAIPSGFASLTSPFSINTGSCATASINLSAITPSQTELQSVVSATGSDNGYYRTLNGLCGTWQKSSASKEMSPGTSNGGSTGGIATVTALGHCGSSNTSNTTWDVGMTISSSAYLPATYYIYDDIDNSHTITSADGAPIATGPITTTATVNRTGLSISRYDALLVQIVSNAGCLSYFNYFISECSPLPVVFKSFNASRTNASTVGLTWTTATEQNSRGFNVQRNDGSGWKNIAFVFSQSVAGSSNADLSYEYKDANGLSGVSQYRIQQVDLDGKASFSIIKAIRGESLAAKLLVYPNPSANGIINVVFENSSGVRDVIVSDAAGRLVKTFKSITNNILVIENLKKGFYTLKVTNRTTAVSSVEKVVIK